MKIAIVSNRKLPDPRVEREIYSLLKKGYEVYYIGGYRGTTGLIDSREIKIYRITGWDHRVNLKIPPYYQWVKRRVSRYLREIKPDIVLASNIYAGIMVHELGYPMIVDDREMYGYKRFTGLNHLSGLRRFLEQQYLMRIKKYEEILAEHHPFIVVTRYSYLYYRYNLGCSRVYVVRNFPLKNEALEPGTPSSDSIVFNYIGREISKQVGSLDDRYYYFNHPRIIRYSINTLEQLYRSGYKVKLIVIGDNDLKSRDFIISTGYIRHIDLYKYIRASHYGIYSYKPSIYHQFISSHRVYMYMLAGKPVILTSSYKDIVETINGYTVLIDAYNYMDDLKKKYSDLIENHDPMEYERFSRKVREYALKNTIWEINENTLYNVLGKVS